MVTDGMNVNAEHVKRKQLTEYIDPVILKQGYFTFSLYNSLSPSLSHSLTLSLSFSFSFSLYSSLSLCAFPSFLISYLS